jgi:hypothetical protein
LYRFGLSKKIIRNDPFFNSLIVSKSFWAADKAEMVTRSLLISCLLGAVIGGAIFAGAGYVQGRSFAEAAWSGVPSFLAHSVSYRLAVYSGILGGITGAVIAASIVLSTGRMSPLAALFKLVWWAAFGGLLGALVHSALAVLGNIVSGNSQLPVSLIIPPGPEGAFIGLAAGLILGLFVIARRAQEFQKAKKRE